MSRHFCLVWRPWNMHVKMNPLNNWVRQSRMKISRERWKISRDYPEPGRENFLIYVYLGWYRALSWKLFFNTAYILFRLRFTLPPDFSIIYILIHLSFHFIVSTEKMIITMMMMMMTTIRYRFALRSFFFLFEKFDNLHVVRYCYIINKKKVVA